MLTHVVLLRFADEHKAENVAEARSRLLAMRGRVPAIASIEAGADVLHSERSFDLALIVRLADRAALAAYAEHPAHQEVLAFLKQVIVQAVVVDYEDA